MAKTRLKRLREVRGQVPHLDQYFGPWAIEPTIFEQAVARVGTIDLAMHVDAQQSQPKSSLDTDGVSIRTTAGGLAVIELHGPLMKYVSSLSGGSSTVNARRKVRAAVKSSDVKGVLLKIDSPGGTVSGTKDLADDVAAAAENKPLHTYAEDCICSAAYWIGSQARRLSTNATCWSGSIGTFAVLYDLSGMAEQDGVKVHVVRAGDLKGMGTPGTVVTDEQLAHVQQIVNSCNEHFLQGVARGRNLSIEAVRQLADGRVHIGQEAVPLKLVDAIESIDDAMEHLQEATGGRSGVRAAVTQEVFSETEDSEMTEQTAPQQPVAATLQDLKSACPGASSDFLLAQLEQKATTQQAVTAWNKSLQEQLEAANKKLEEASSQTTETTQTAPAPRKVGVPPVGAGTTSTDADSSTDASAEFETAVEKQMASGVSRQQAIANVATKHPELHQAFLSASNPGAPQQRLLADKFGG